MVQGVTPVGNFLQQFSVFHAGYILWIMPSDHRSQSYPVALLSKGPQDLLHLHKRI